MTLAQDRLYSPSDAYCGHSSFHVARRNRDRHYCFCTPIDWVTWPRCNCAGHSQPFLPSTHSSSYGSTPDSIRAAVRQLTASCWIRGRDRETLTASCGSLAKRSQICCHHTFYPPCQHTTACGLFLYYGYYRLLYDQTRRWDDGCRGLDGGGLKSLDDTSFLDIDSTRLTQSCFC